jgi:hypothetical protein
MCGIMLFYWAFFVCVCVTNIAFNQGSGGDVGNFIGTLRGILFIWSMGILCGGDGFRPSRRLGVR